MFSISDLLLIKYLELSDYVYQSIDESTDYSFKKDFSRQQRVTEGFQYKTGFIFYLDILGCRRLSLKSSEDEASLTKVKKIVEAFQEIEKRYKDVYWGKNYMMPFTHEGSTVDKCLGETDISVTMSLFSDSIIISYYPEVADRFVIWYEQMYQIFNDICRIIYLFASNGVFLRGGMSYGEFYHCGSVCFGPALLEAVKLEGEICYPTVSISDSFRKRIFEDLSSKEIDDFSPGYKDPYELKSFAADFFSIFLDSTIVNGQTKMMLNWMMAVFYYHLDRIDAVKKAIMEELNVEYPEKIKEKYTWLAKLFNHSLSGLISLGVVNYSYAKIDI